MTTSIIGPLKDVSSSTMVGSLKKDCSVTPIKSTIIVVGWEYVVRMACHVSVSTVHIGSRKHVAANINRDSTFLMVRPVSPEQIEDIVIIMASVTIQAAVVSAMIHFISGPLKDAIRITMVLNLIPISAVSPIPGTTIAVG
mmetsp:Transcript_24977/g.36857  ORF Transcript_24977/g.36857 Transcript_24977/m.36857 type:complete len:141 (+) Transcript_24977:1360-1782(+)